MGNDRLRNVRQQNKKETGNRGTTRAAALRSSREGYISSKITLSSTTYSILSKSGMKRPESLSISFDMLGQSHWHLTVPAAHIQVCRCDPHLSAHASSEALRRPAVLHYETIYRYEHEWAYCNIACCSSLSFL
jgi:hypothetical protein